MPSKKEKNLRAIGWRKTRIVLEIMTPPIGTMVPALCDFFHDGKWQHCAPSPLDSVEILSTHVKEVA